MAKKKPINHNEPWDVHDLRKLRALARQRLSARLAAKVLGRSTGSVKYKAMIEGISFRAINQKRGVQKRLAGRRRRR